MPQDVWTPMTTSDNSLRNKSLRARSKVAHVELLRGLVLRCAVTVIYRNQQRKKPKKSSVFRKIKESQKQKKTTTFGASLFLIESDTQFNASKYKRPRNKPNDGCLWKPAKRNSVRASKQLRFVAITETFNGNQA